MLPLRSSQFSKKTPFLFAGNCVFCLRKLSGSGQTGKGKNVDKCARNVSSDISLQIVNQVMKHVSASRQEEFPGFVQTPPICLFCAVEVKRISNLLTDLEKATQDLRSVIKRAEREGRVREFFRELEEAKIEENEKLSTVQLLQQIGHSVTVKEIRSLQFHYKHEELKSPVAAETYVPEVKNEDDWAGEDTRDTWEDGTCKDYDEYDDNEPKDPDGMFPDPDAPEGPASPADNWDESSEGDDESSNERVKSIPCDFCGDVQAPEDILSHVQAHVGEYTLKCPNPSCSLAFATTTSMKKHLGAVTKCYDHSSDNFDLCRTCGHQAPGQLFLRTHLQIVHETTNSRTFQCPVESCTEAFSLRQSVFCHINYKHRFKPTENKPFKKVQKCPLCGDRMSKDSGLDHLVADHGTMVDSIISCKLCHFVFTQYDQLLDHLHLHMRRGRGDSVNCDLCQKNFSRIEDLRKHYHSVHQIGSPFRCNLCEKLFWSSDQLKRHVRNHNSESRKKSGKRFKCDLCPEETPFRTQHQTALMTHKIAKHGADPYKCQSCGKTFTDFRKYKIHDLQHKGELPPEAGLFKCDIAGCGKTFTSRHKLVIHRTSIVHSGRTNAFLCGDCGKGFNTKKTLQRHIQNMHAEEKSTFVCDECGAVLANKGNLKKHKEEIHTNPMVLNCHMCNRRFNQRRALARHLAHLKPDGSCLGEKNFRPDWRKRRQEKLERERASQQLNT